MTCSIVLALWLLASPVEPPLTIEFSAPEEVPLLAEIELGVSVTNTGGERVTVREPILDDRSFSFRVRFGGQGVESRYTAFHPGAGLGSTVAGRYLEPGESMEFLHAVPAIAAGTWTFRPVFSGLKGHEPIVGEPKTVEVVPAESERGEAVDHAVLRIETASGAIEARLWPDVAPSTSLHIARLARDGFYAGTKFHRVIKGFMIQGGVRDERGAGYTIPAEFSERSHVRGVLSMARLGDPQESPTRAPAHKYKDSARTSFFICHGDATYLDRRYTAFGAVERGMDVVDAIAGAAVEDNGYGELSRPRSPVVIEALTLALPSGADRP